MEEEERSGEGGGRREASYEPSSTCHVLARQEYTFMTTLDHIEDTEKRRAHCKVGRQKVAMQ